MGRSMAVVALAAALVATMVAAAVAAPSGEPAGPGSAATGERHVIVLRDGPGPVAEVAVEVLDDAVTEVGGPLVARLLTPLLTDRIVATHGTALRSFVLDGPSMAVVDALEAHPSVALVEQDRPLDLAGVPTGVDRVDADRLPAAGLGSGRDVDADVAVIDTGVDLDHPDLRVVSSRDCTSGTCGPGGDDHDGHGTHVAGVMAARDDGRGPVGVAPGARVWSLKVLDGLGGSTSASRVLSALDVVAEHADRVDVANISLSGRGRSIALDRAIDRVSDLGVTVVVAAGNTAEDAGHVTPANAPDALTVSAVNDTDGRPGARGGGSCGPDDTLASWSNTGHVVDVAAPGSCITSLALGGGTQGMSGTSMAAPHVAGAALQYVAINQLEGTDRAEAVRAGMLDRWTTPQHGPCGFAGGASGEPMLLLVPCGQPVNQPAPDRDPAPPPTERPTSPDAARPAPVPEVAVAAVTMDDSRRLVLFRAIESTVTVTADGSRLDGAVVEAVLVHDGEVVDRLRGRTGDDGTVDLRATNVDDGCHRLRVTEVVARGRVHHPATPDNEVCGD